MMLPLVDGKLPMLPPLTADDRYFMFWFTLGFLQFEDDVVKSLTHRWTSSRRRRQEGRFYGRCEVCWHLYSFMRCRLNLARLTTREHWPA